MKTRILHSRIYTDSFFMELSSIEKLLFIYYLTNDAVNIIHCYECPDKKVQNEIGVSIPLIKRYQEKVEKAGKMFFKDGYVFLKNASKYESYTGVLNEKAKESLLDQLSEEIRNWYEGSMKGVYIPTINQKSEIINHKSEEEGIVKGRLDLPIETLQGIADKQQVPLSFVLSKQEDVNNWVEEKPTRARGRDLRKTLVVWVKKDAINIRKEAHGKSKLTIISPDPDWVSTS